MNNLNERQERFAELIAAGKPASVAYVQAGYAGGKQAEANGWRMIRNEKVSARIAELKAQNREVAAIDRARAMRILEEVILTPVGQVGPDHFLCQEYREASEHSGAVVKMPAKLEAMDKLAKMLGWYEADKNEGKIADSIAEMMRGIRQRRDGTD